LFTNALSVVWSHPQNDCTLYALTLRMVVVLYACALPGDDVTKEDGGRLEQLGDLLEERFEGDAALLILGWAALLQDGFQFSLLKTLTKGHEDVLQLSVHHGAVLSLVVQLQDFHEIFEGAGILVLLDLCEDGEEVVDLNDLLLPLFLASDLLDDGQGRVKVQGTQAVANVVGVHCAITLEVIDGEGEFHPLNITSTEIRGHFVI